ncbi:MAG: arylesterase [Ectothiorhodospiraceae bacterium]|nr:arylesterase [Ectothiorhodospiraceae bacterium]
MRAGVVALAVVLTACDSGPRLQPLAGDAVVLAFGDSLTHGTGATPEESYPAVLSRLIGREVINAGVPGEVTERGLARLPALLDEIAPALVVLCHGGNDFLRRLDRGAAERNLREMVRLARERGAQVVLLAVPAPSLMLSAADLYGRVAEEMAIPLESDIVPDLLGDNGYKSDAVHPNAAGYARLAKAVAALLEDRGAL